MGFYLTVLPFDDKLNYSFDVLSFKKTSSKLFDKIIELESKKGRNVPAHFRSYLGKNGYGEKTNTPYGEHLKYVLIIDFLKCLKKNQKYINHWKNKAICNYLEEFPASWKLALYWH